MGYKKNLNQNSLCLKVELGKNQEHYINENFFYQHLSNLDTEQFKNFHSDIISNVSAILESMGCCYHAHGNFKSSTGHIPVQILPLKIVLPAGNHRYVLGLKATECLFKVKRAKEQVTCFYIFTVDLENFDYLFSSVFIINCEQGLEN